MKAKILGLVVIILVLAGVGILAFNWRMIASPQTTTRTTGSASKKIKIPDNGCYLGAYIGTDTTGQFEEKTRKRFAISHIYFSWVGDFPSKALEEVVKSGKIPLMSWSISKYNPTSKRADLPIRMQEIIDGKYDEWLSRWANDAKSFGYPLLLDPGYGMNGEWMLWSGANNFGKYSNQTWKEVDDLYRYYGDPLRPDGPERFVDAWRHVHDIFRRNEVTNIEWVWTTTNPGPDLPWNSFNNYYPGDNYVNWVGSFVYNFGFYETESGIIKAWKDFDSLFTGYNPIKVYTTYSHKPFMITELGCSQESLRGVSGDKAAWIIDAFQKIKSKYRNVRAVILFSVDKRAEAAIERDWRVDSSPETLEAFRRALSDPYFLDRIMFESGGSTAPSAVLHSAIVMSTVGRTSSEKRLKR